MSMRKYYIETYGCQMNVADSELVAGILEEQSYRTVGNPEDADLILVNTCSVRENADKRAIARLRQFKHLKKQNPNLLLGLMGCVAQRDRGRILEENSFIDIVLGPDTYRRFPEIIEKMELPFIDVQLSRHEVYDDLLPKRQESVNAWISIMRGCDKFCAFCIVPFTRGRERSRSVGSILREVKDTVAGGFKEITLLGQNVNSYRFEDIRFPELLEGVAAAAGNLRIRFTSPHPRDVDDKMLAVMQKYDNICSHIHLPLQAGSTKVLKAMNRNYTQKDYLELVEKIRYYLPDVALTTDLIVGFPGETATDFAETLFVMDRVMFDNAFMFKYSPRPMTQAAKMSDDVSEVEKSDRLLQVIEKQKMHTDFRNRAVVGTLQEVLIDDYSKKNPVEKRGRTLSNKIVILKRGNPELGSLVQVKVSEAAGVSLFGELQ